MKKLFRLILLTTFLFNGWGARSQDSGDAYYFFAAVTVDQTPGTGGQMDSYYITEIKQVSKSVFDKNNDSWSKQTRDWVKKNIAGGLRVDGDGSAYQASTLFGDASRDNVEARREQFISGAKVNGMKIHNFTFDFTTKSDATGN